MKNKLLQNLLMYLFIVLLIIFIKVEIGFKVCMIAIYFILFILPDKNLRVSNLKRIILCGSIVYWAAWLIFK